MYTQLLEFTVGTIYALCMVRTEVVTYNVQRVHVVCHIDCHIHVDYRHLSGSAFCSFHKLGVPEQALVGIPLGLGLLWKINLSNFHVHKHVHLHVQVPLLSTNIHQFASNSIKLC